MHEPAAVAEKLADTIDWIPSSGHTGYIEAVAFMEARVAAIAGGRAQECIWLVEHPPLYTAGISARPEHLLSPDRLPVYSSGRGGQMTYHGPGQRVVYVMLDLRRRFGGDVRTYVRALQSWVVQALGRLEIDALTRKDHIGVWAYDRQDSSRPVRKISAIGVRVRRGISYHGVSVNVTPDLEHYSGIVPCGMREADVTSMAHLGADISMTDLDQALLDTFGTLSTGRINVRSPTPMWWLDRDQYEFKPHYDKRPAQ